MIHCTLTIHCTLKYLSCVRSFENYTSCVPKFKLPLMDITEVLILVIKITRVLFLVITMTQSDTPSYDILMQHVQLASGSISFRRKEDAGSDSGSYKPNHVTFCIFFLFSRVGRFGLVAAMSMYIFIYIYIYICPLFMSTFSVE